MSVVRERALHTVTNYFIVSLAIADLLVAVVVMPFGVYILVSAHYKSFIIPRGTEGLDPFGTLSSLMVTGVQWILCAPQFQSINRVNRK